jgi:drug/metabolite transporter (DMT)-like permease
MGAVAQMAWTSAACGVTLLAIALAEGTFAAPPDPRTAACVVGVALVAQVVGWVLLARSIPRVPVALAGLLLLLQPAFAVGWEALFFGRTLSALELVGCATTLAAIYAGSVARYIPRDAAAGAPPPALVPSLPRPAPSRPPERSDA